MKKVFAILFISILIMGINNHLFAGNVDVSPGAGAYATLQAAFTAINSGPAPHGNNPVVTINADFTEPAGAILNGTNITTCIIRPTGTFTITGDFAEAIIVLIGADNVIIDGRINSSGLTRSLTLTNINAGLNMGCIRMSDGSSNNIVRYVICNGVGVGGTAGGRIINIAQSSDPTAQGGNNNNIIENNLVNRGRRGIQVFGTSSLTPPGVTNDGTIIKGNVVKNISSTGIFVGSETRDNTVDSNECFNDLAVFGDVTNLGVREISCQGVGTNNITRNKVRDLGFTNATDSLLYGFYLIPVTLTAPGTNNSTHNINNNFFAMNSDNPDVRQVYGMFLVNIASPCIANVYFNSVRMGGTTGAIRTLSLGIEEGITGTGSEYNGFNNISINARTGGTGNTQHIGMDLNPSPGVTLSSDNNTVFALDTASGRGWAAGYNGFVYRDNSLYHDSAIYADIEHLTAFDNVHFVSNTDLHLAGKISGNMDAKNITGITTDIDGDSRAITSTNLFTYRGADEHLPTGGAAWRKVKKTIILSFQGYINPGRISTNPPYGTCYVWDPGDGSTDLCVPRRNIPLSGPLLTVFTIFAGDSIGAGPYWIEILGKNTVQTWSAAPVSFAADTSIYDFTPSLSQAYGNNMFGTSPPFQIYTGDVNQDNVIDGSDAAAVDNDATNFVGGLRIDTDVNFDQIVDGSDAAIVDNNATNFVSAVIPPGFPNAPFIQNTNDGNTKNYTMPKTITTNINASGN